MQLCTDSGDFSSQGTTSPEELVNMAADRINDLHRNLQYFIDGSLDGDKAGAVFYSEGDHGAKRLSDVELPSTVREVMELSDSQMWSCLRQ